MRLALFLLLIPSLALAQPASSSTDARDMADNDCARARKLKQTCVLKIGPEEIEGGVLKPEGSIVDARIFPYHQSLVRIRRDFIAEILKSANDID